MSCYELIYSVLEGRDVDSILQRQLYKRIKLPCELVFVFIEELHIIDGRLFEDFVQGETLAACRDKCRCFQFQRKTQLVMLANLSRVIDYSD